MKTEAQKNSKKPFPPFRRGAAVLCLSAAAALLLSSCGSSHASKAGQGGGGAEAAADAYEDIAYNADTAKTFSSLPSVEPRETAQAEGGAADPQFSAAAASLKQRKLIKNVSLQLETKEFDSLLSGIQSRLDEMNGYLENSWISGKSLQSDDTAELPSSSRRASLTARIPADRLDAFLNEISGSANVVSRSDQVNDVTLQYSDIESHKKSLTTERERLWELLAQAESIESVIALQTRIGEIEYELNSYESQLRLYDNQVAYSSVQMEIEEVGSYKAAKDDSVASRIRLGFSANILRVWEFLQDLFVALVINLPFWLLLAVPMLILFLIVKFLSAGKKRRSERRQKSEASEKAEPPAKG